MRTLWLVGWLGVYTASALAGSPFWRTGQMAGEPLLFVKRSGGAPSCANLLFRPTSAPVLTNFSGELTYLADIDYTWSGEKICLPSDSKVPALDEAKLFPPPHSPDSIGYHKRKRNTNLLFSNDGKLFFGLQALANYRFSPVPAFAAAGASKAHPLVRAEKAWKKGEPLTLIALGDSITRGLGSSGSANMAPRQPGYFELVVAGLKRPKGPALNALNYAESGAECPAGVEVAKGLAPQGAVLVILAYGMNDAGARTPPEKWGACLRLIIKTLREKNAATEFILVSSMSGNPDWHLSAPGLYLRYRNELRTLEAPGVVLADVYAAWMEVRKTKAFVELTGNGVNHPNDFGHRLYADVILATLGFR